MSKTYLPYDPDQQLLLPAALASAALLAGPLGLIGLTAVRRRRRVRGRCLPAAFPPCRIAVKLSAVG